MFRVDSPLWSVEKYWRQKIICSQQFELEHLSGMKITTQLEAFEAMMFLHNKGTEVVILSSSEICTEPGLNILEFPIFLVCATLSIPMFIKTCRCILHTCNFGPNLAFLCGGHGLGNNFF
jgi:hypothetical protein